MPISRRTRASFVRRRVAYRSVRGFVKEFRANLSRGFLQITWPNAPDVHSVVQLSLIPPFGSRAFEIPARVVHVQDETVGVELLELDKFVKLELEQAVKTFEGIGRDFHRALKAVVDSGRIGPGAQFPIPPVLATYEARVKRRSGDPHPLRVSFDHAVSFLAVYRTQWFRRELFVRMKAPPHRGTPIRLYVTTPHASEDVELDAVLVEQSGDEIQLELLDPDEDGQLRLDRQVKCCEQIGAEVADELSEHHGTLAFTALRHLLPEPGAEAPRSRPLRKRAWSADAPRPTEEELDEQAWSETTSPGAPDEDAVQTIPETGDADEIAASAAITNEQAAAPATTSSAGSSTDWMRERMSRASSRPSGRATRRTGRVPPPEDPTVGPARPPKAAAPPTPEPQPAREAPATGEELVRPTPFDAPLPHHVDRDGDEAMPPLSALSPTPAAPEPVPEAEELVAPTAAAPEPPPERPRAAKPAAALTTFADDIPLPDLPPAGPPPAAVGAVVDTSTPEMEGSFLETRPIEVLGALGKQGATGVLTIEGANRTAKIALRGGRIYHCGEQPPRSQYLLGNLLIHLKADARKVNAASIQAREQGVPIGRLLLDNRSIEEVQLSRALVTQLKTRMGSLDGWVTGNFEFRSGVPRAPTAHAPTVAPVRLVFLGRLDNHARKAPRTATKEQAPFNSHYVTPVKDTTKWVAKLGFNRDQLKLWELVRASRYRFQDLVSELEMDPHEAFATLFALRDLGLVELHEQLDSAVRLQLLIERFEAKSGAVRGANLFDVLEVHWSSGDDAVLEGYERVRELFDAANVADAPPEIIPLSQTIIGYVESAYETLKDTKARREYREGIVDEPTIRQAADLIVRQGDLSVFKQDWPDAKLRYDAALELIPSNREVQEKLTRMVGLQRASRERARERARDRGGD